MLPRPVLCSPRPRTHPRCLWGLPWKPCCLQDLLIPGNQPSVVSAQFLTWPPTGYVSCLIQFAHCAEHTQLVEVRLRAQHLLTVSSYSLTLRPQ